jgi:hypothetical protein
MAECCTCVRDEQTVLIWLIRAGMWPACGGRASPRPRPPLTLGQRRREAPP